MARAGTVGNAAPSVTATKTAAMHGAHACVDHCSVLMGALVKYVSYRARTAVLDLCFPRGITLTSGVLEIC